MKYSTEERIHPLRWDSEKRRAKTSKLNVHSLELNVYLENLYNLAVTPTLTIMAITRHRTEKAFLRYIRLVPSDHARLLKAHWEKRKAGYMDPVEV
ncbi:hypothetical protein [Puia dinghuensis]|nr:hypothetical protein [Puia dinghuensis]